MAAAAVNNGGSGGVLYGQTAMNVAAALDATAALATTADSDDTIKNDAVA
eukprot:CAMPEP_0198681746 /NCGR_PEP_ID=MMETSP1468-20131203/7416_1 /TAXON_ID=1461545 /ORGANISM="Mantoniella sp, Strain CCMP1436" /LENGTH=49 /DNA_ID= /DNA_START= /DNA_END= /DNA_ORIENTATION=